jgi:sugar/nucleoside kinase (ribokinase family)
MTETNPFPRDLFVGELKHDFSLSLDNQKKWDAPGGSALYAAVGYLVWEKKFSPGICTRVGENYPQEWLESFQSRGISVAGVQVLSKPLELRSFTIQEESEEYKIDHPVVYYSRAGLSLPSGLIGYTGSGERTSSRRISWESAIREADLPPEYQSATGAHLCPLDYQSHNLLPAVLRRRGFSTITLDPDSSYMDPAFLGDLPSIITGLTAFMPTEAQLIELYKGKTTDLWEISEELGRYGCELIVIKRGSAGVYIYQPDTGDKWDLSAYPARSQNPLGSGAAFCGGFLAGFRDSFDPIQAALKGLVSASLVEEGNSPFFALEALPGLAQARLEYLQEGIYKV